MFKLKSSALPSHQSSQQLAEDFNDFFINKISDIRAGLNNTEAASVEDRELSCSFTDFEIPSHAYIVEVLGSLTPKTCDLDPIPTSVLKQHVLELAPTIARIVSASLASGEFPSSLKTSIVRPKLKKPDLDSEIYQNYRPLANISFISKVIEGKTVEKQWKNRGPAFNISICEKSLTRTSVHGCWSPCEHYI